MSHTHTQVPAVTYTHSALQQKASQLQQLNTTTEYSTIKTKS